MLCKNLSLKFSILFIFCLMQTFGYYEECSKVYIVPMFSEKARCMDGLSDTCNNFIKIFLGNCAKAATNIRQLISVFNFHYSIVYSCITENALAICRYEYDDRNDVTLRPHKHFSIRQKFQKQIEEDQREECYNNSIAIFLTDITVRDYKYYPDVNSLFGFGLNDTRQWLFDLKLHAYAVWIDNYGGEKDYWTDEMKNLTFSGTNFLEARRYFYYQMYDPNLGLKMCKANDFPEATSKYTPPKKSNLTVIVSISCGVVSLLIFLWFGFWTRQIYKRWRESKVEAFADKHSRNVTHLLFGNYLDEWEVTPKELKVDQENVLGKGAFATVYKGYLKKKRNDGLIEMDVAVKFPHDYASEEMREDMIKEIGFMKALGSHENLLVMVGYVKSVDNPVICTVYCASGDLLEILRKHDLHYMTKEKCTEVKICLLLKDLLRLSVEICSGLEYLATLRYVHRDIAARNVLLTDKLVAKLSDFGLCRQLEDDEEFLIEKDGKFPIKYMPYESLKFGQFNEKSDVWSYGILIFEMFSGGERPFLSVPAEEFVNECLGNDGKPEFPIETPNEILHIVNNHCFQKEPELRATFSELKEVLEEFYNDVLQMDE